MGVYSTKQYIIIRKDLGMKKGKIAAQAAHASMGALLSISHDRICPERFNEKVIPMTEDVEAWLKGSFAKVALAVNSEEELKECYEKVKEMGLPVAYIVDNGTTVFNGVPTPTCVGIGPAKSEILEPLFQHLKLF